MNKKFFILILLFIFISKKTLALSHLEKLPFGISLVSVLNSAFSNIEAVDNYPQIKFFYGKKHRNWLWVINGQSLIFGLSQDERSIFKIHLQIKKKYCVDFIRDLAVEILRVNGMFSDLEKINNYKITFNFYKESRRRGVPVSVFYLPKKSTDFLRIDKNRQDFLNGYIRAFVQYSNNWCLNKNLKIEDVGLPFKPNFNLRINPIVYIAGGNRLDKENDNVKYELTDGKVFYKGFEYIFDSKILEDESKIEEID